MCCSGVVRHTPVIQGIFVVNSYCVNNSQGFKLKLASLRECPVLASGLEQGSGDFFHSVNFTGNTN